MKARLLSKTEINPGIFRFDFEHIPGFTYLPGQFTELTLHDSSGLSMKHWFTFSSAPHEQFMSITTKIASPVSHFKNTLNSIPLRSTVDIAEPMGDFVVPKDSTIPLLFIAAGIGITPFRSILLSLHESHDHRDISLLYADSSPSGFTYYTELAELGNAAVHRILTRPNNSWAEIQGTLNATTILELLKPTRQHYIYTSGPEHVVEILHEDLAEHGIDRSNLITDYFAGYSDTL